MAALCAPLDLSLSQQAIDSPVRWPYRRYLMSSLIDIFAAVSARRPQKLTAAQAARIRTIREWDDLVVAPRHGFADAADYYARASVAPRLGDLRVPALLVNSEGDPMVPARPVRSVLRPAPRLEVRWVAGGGHVSLSPGARYRREPGWKTAPREWTHRCSAGCGGNRVNRENKKDASEGRHL